MAASLLARAHGDLMQPKFGMGDNRLNPPYMRRRMEITTDKNGVTESGKEVPVGTVCTYECHVPGGMVRVTLPDGSVEIVHPHIFAALR
jgi:hypothetical protein